MSKSDNKNIFTNFNYRKKDSNLVNHHEYYIDFSYKGEEVTYVTYVKDKDSLDLVKKKIESKIKDGTLERYAKWYLRKLKGKPSLLVPVIACVTALAIAGAGVGTYYALKSEVRGEEVKVDVPETNGLAFSNQKAYIGQDYDTDITINKTLTDLLLPDTLTTVTSGNRTLLPTEYTYTVSDNKEKASLHIPGKFIEGDVRITLELVNPVPPVKYASIELSENSKKYGKLKYGETTDYKVDITDKIDSKEFEIEFVPEGTYEETKFVVSFSDSNFIAEYVNKVLKIEGTDPLKDQDQLVITLAEPTARDQYLTFTSLEDDSKISVIYDYYSTSEIIGTKIPNLQYSTDDGVTWTNAQLPTESGASVVLIDDFDEGDTVIFRGNNPDGFNYDVEGDEGTEYNAMRFYTSENKKKFAVSGNIMSLIKPIGFGALEAIPTTGAANGHGCFNRLFSDSSIVDASELILPAKSLTPYCYNEMFDECDLLESAPELPATELAVSCYQDMFAGTNITTAPDLKAETLAESCYREMFLDTPIINPPVISATTLAPYCFAFMFMGCTSLTSTVGLPKLEFKQCSCFQMYYACTSLSTIYPIEYSNNSFDSDDLTFQYMFFNAGLTITKSDASQDNTIFHVGDTDDFGFCYKMFGDSVTMEANKYYNFTYLWYKDTKYLNSLEPSDVTKVNPDGTIGEVKTLKVNGLDHKVRLIGVGEDEDAGGNTIHTTWEFVNLISDENGYSLATQWNDTDDGDTSNHNYKDSSVRMALVGEKQDAGHILWAQKEATVWSNEPEGPYTNKTVLDMLDEGNPGLVDVIKAPSKWININDGDGWEEETINDKLFLLSPAEMGRTERTHEETKTATYSYYEDAQDIDRVKKQVNSDVYAPIDDDVLEIPGGSGQTYSNVVSNYAGYNSKSDASEGGYLWLRSPCTDFGFSAWKCNNQGTLDGYFYTSHPSSYAYAVAPAFCI